MVGQIGQQSLAGRLGGLSVDLKHMPPPFWVLQQKKPHEENYTRGGVPLRAACRLHSVCYYTQNVRHVKVDFSGIRRSMPVSLTAKMVL